MSVMTTARVTCLCSRNQQDVELICDLPYETYTCMCNTCRHTTGQLFAICIPISQAAKPSSFLKSYDSTEKLRWHFCAICGSHMFISRNAGQTWKVCSGAVDRIPNRPGSPPLALTNIQRHEFVADTKDGGLSLYMEKMHGHAVLVHLDGPDTPPKASWLARVRELEASSGSTNSREDRTQLNRTSDTLTAQCHCGGVKYYITRPDVQSSQFSAPWPDLLRPYHSYDSANPDGIKWWLCGSKYLTGTCACRSCRLAGGFPIQCWAFVPRHNIRWANGDAMDFERGTLAHFESSPGVLREFCTVCGATAFWRCADRPALIDVSVGLLRATEGSRADSWLSWHKQRVSFKEDAFEPDFVGQLESQLQASEK